MLFIAFDSLGNRRLLLAFLASGLLHALIGAWIKPVPARDSGARFIHAKLIDAVHFASPSENETDSLPPKPVAAALRQHRGEIANDSVLNARRESPPLKADGNIRELPRYYTGREVDVRATPVQLSDRLRTLDEPPPWRMARAKLRLFINEAGGLDRFEIIESEGLTDPKLLDDLMDARFHPAMKDDRPVKSQKIVEISFPL